MLEWLYFLGVGVVAGAVATRFMRGRGFGLSGNMIVAAIGAVAGILLLDLFGLGVQGLIARLIMAGVGAIVLVGSLGMVRRI